MKKRIAANPGRCIGCRTCEIACALAHSELRIEDMTASDFKARVAILKYEDISTPVACRQCEDAPCAAALVECGFLSNYGEARRFSDPAQLDATAAAIARGIADYINQVRKAQLALP